MSELWLSSFSHTGPETQGLSCCPQVLLPEVPHTASGPLKVYSAWGQPLPLFVPFSVLATHHTAHDCPLPCAHANLRLSVSGTVKLRWCFVF